ncbi:MAG: ABC transporter ATP-binding protein [Phycisphaerales bacterium]|nr:ABC transporter ATP-binding protein [Phycisphaerales bacterium]
MTALHLEQLTKRFGTRPALDRVTLSLAPGEILCVLGQSGCGKSTLLRIIAGLLKPTSGRVRFGEQDVTQVRAERRGVAMCFQSLALWPHLTAEENIRVGLSRQHLSHADANARIAAIAQQMHVGPLLTARPGALSGGEQQRIALARALVTQPRLLLLDEPLSSLDAPLRRELRTEIRDLCKSKKLTTIYVTHDADEAFAVGDRLAVLQGGRVVQVGTPQALRTEPQHADVARLLGVCHDKCSTPNA